MNLREIPLEIVVLLLLSLLRDSTPQTSCPQANLPTLSNGQFFLSPNITYAIYYCSPGYRFENTAVTTFIVTCNFMTGNWIGILNQCIDANPCASSPCKNGGVCLTEEDPFNMGFSCVCLGAFGGMTCEISDPCSTCPGGTVGCYITYADASGRFCFDGSWNLLV